MNDIMDFSIQPVAIATNDGHLHIMNVIEQAPTRAFSEVAATKAGFELKDGKWSRKVTDEVIESEIARTPSVAINKGWRRISQSEIPEERAKRDKLMDDGKKLAHRND